MDGSNAQAVRRGGSSFGPGPRRGRDPEGGERSAWKGLCGPSGACNGGYLGGIWQPVGLWIVLTWSAIAICFISKHSTSRLGPRRALHPLPVIQA